MPAAAFASTPAASPAAEGRVIYLSAYVRQEPPTPPTEDIVDLLLEWRDVGREMNPESLRGAIVHLRAWLQSSDAPAPVIRFRR